MNTLYELIKAGSYSHSEVSGQNEYLYDTAQRLIENNLVAEDFYEAIIQREKNYPTGLQTKVYGIAIPHVESQYVNESGLHVTKFEKPIIFHRMDDAKEVIEVHVSFMLLIENSNNHMEALKDLISYCQNEKFLNELLNIEDKTSLLELVKRIKENG